MKGEFPKSWQFRTHNFIWVSESFYGLYKCKNCSIDGLFRLEEIFGEANILGVFNLTCAEIIMENILK